jgi:hypothetical protein
MLASCVPWGTGSQAAISGKKGALGPWVPCLLQTDNLHLEQTAMFTKNKETKKLSISALAA